MWQASSEPAWIFVSHASKDLVNVRKVRNYLEEKGAAPLLFHLKAMQKPEQFWPLIEQEIAVRRFFLYCDSPAAKSSEWVAREREAVGCLEIQPKIGHVDVSADALDTAALDAFLKRTRIYTSFSRLDMDRVKPILNALTQADFQVFDLQENDLLDIEDPDRRRLAAERQSEKAIEQVVSMGIFMPFLSSNALRSDWTGFELDMALAKGARMAPVILDPDASMHPFMRKIAHLNWAVLKGEPDDSFALRVVAYAMRLS